MNLSNLAKFILGFTLAIALTLGGAVAASLYLVARLTALAPKPEVDSPQAPTPTPARTTPTPQA
ncbi:MAG: SH3 domain-containing protein, partial [Sodalinema sp.]